MTTRESSLKGMTWDHPRAYTCLVAASDLYEKKTGCKVHWDKRSLQAFADQPIEDLASEYDLIILDHPHVGQISESGCLSALPDIKSITDRSIGGSSQSYIWQGKQWSYAIDAACQVAVKRADLSTDFPAHWEDILTQDTARYRLLTPLKPVDAFDMMLTLVASCGEEALPLNKVEFCSSQYGLLALKILKRLYNTGPSEAVLWNPIDVLEVLSESDDFHASPCLFGYINYARAGFRTHQLEYIDLPTFKEHRIMRGILGGAGIGVSARSGNLETAKHFAAWVASADIQSGVYLENEGQPAHLDAWQKRAEDPRYAGFLSGAFNTMNSAWTRPREEWFLHFVDDVCEIFPDFFLKDLPDTNFLDAINKLYQHHTTRT